MLLLLLLLQVRWVNTNRQLSTRIRGAKCIGGKTVSLWDIVDIVADDSRFWPFPRLVLVNLCVQGITPAAGGCLATINVLHDISADAPYDQVLVVNIGSRNKTRAYKP